MCAYYYLFLAADCSRCPFLMLESTLGDRDAASADWRICPTPFEPRQRLGRPARPWGLLISWRTDRIRLAHVIADLSGQIQSNEPPKGMACSISLNSSGLLARTVNGLLASLYANAGLEPRCVGPQLRLGPWRR